MSVAQSEPEHLSQRELRNESSRVLREVSEGRSFVLTNRGVPVGRLEPLDAPPARLPITRPAKRIGGWSTLGIERTPGQRSVCELIGEQREDRV
ncbi:type II toxin-antitoxin system prevent-host-death family antitoxin [Brevibacterium luteolum]|uniref:type II toxin-antitoxin system Phd/YefM family antitoxin n=1 Tax=Brevibacterium luteolum TaxID=199591 RepID=UPI0021AFBCF7|nr:type II toxin-antitoxin system prevent-host-death family antitoxin [Brevibacterium luteolum]MCT1922444.1 type II toxin-antitoxin system prevent-host-death family antitoxin [Brevibacterium luteolum]